MSDEDDSSPRKQEEPEDDDTLSTGSKDSKPGKKPVHRTPRKQENLYTPTQSAKHAQEIANLRSQVRSKDTQIKKLQKENIDLKHGKSPKPLQRSNSMRNVADKSKRGSSKDPKELKAVEKDSARGAKPKSAVKRADGTTSPGGAKQAVLRPRTTSKKRTGAADDDVESNTTDDSSSSRIDKDEVGSERDEPAHSPKMAPSSPTNNDADSRADSASPSDRTREEELERKVKELTKELEKLKGGKSSKPPTPRAADKAPLSTPKGKKPVSASPSTKPKEKEEKKNGSGVVKKSSKKEDLKDTEVQLLDALSLVENLQKTVFEMEKEKNEAQEESKSLREEMAAISSKVSSATSGGSDRTELLKQIEELQSSVLEYQQKYDEARKQRKASLFNQDVDEMRSMIADLQNSVMELKKENETLKNRPSEDQLMSQIEDLQQAVLDYQEETSQLKKKHQQLLQKQRKMTDKDKNVKLQEQIQNLTFQMFYGATHKDQQIVELKNKIRSLTGAATLSPSTSHALSSESESSSKPQFVDSWLAGDTNGLPPSSGSD